MPQALQICWHWQQQKGRPADSQGRLDARFGLDDVPDMSTVQEIKSAIEQLPLQERAALVAELCGWTDDDWDRRMKADAKAGKFAALNEAAGNAYRSGQIKPLDGNLGQP